MRASRVARDTQSTLLLLYAQEIDDGGEPNPNPNPNQEMTEENLKRRRKELESMLGIDPGSEEPE